MAQHLKPRIVTDGLMFNLDTLGGRGSNTIITKPTAIDDCVLWLDADDESTVITSGTNITNWLDKSGNNNNAEDHGDAEYPQYDGSTVNGRKVINFTATSNSSGDVLKGAFASGSQPFSGSTGGTIIIVFKQKCTKREIQIQQILDFVFYRMALLYLISMRILLVFKVQMVIIFILIIIFILHIQ